jgi:UDP-N-acetylglucosamine 2-epimerase (non-hydrolysing)
MRKIAVFTGTRAEYGLLYWLMNDIRHDSALQLQLIVSGAHLSAEFGNTWQLIEKDGFRIDAKVEMLSASDSASNIAKSVGKGITAFADTLADLQPDVIVILGDRYEALAIAQTAMLMAIPILHLHGGELTEGAYDDAIRHAITKFSQYHGVAAEAYRQRVIQMGEQPDRVYNVGAMGLDHLQRSTLMSLAELSASLHFALDKPFFVVTYHPVTLADEPPVASFQSLLQALDNFPGFQVIITYPNADTGGRSIMPLLESWAAQQPLRVCAIPSLGQIRYLSALKYCSAVIGNSSSGIIEVPSFNKPTVNIGERQRGRLAAESVIHCQANVPAIRQAITQACAANYTDHPVNNPYGQGNASAQVLEILKTMSLNCMKHFHDLPVCQNTPERTE